MYAGINAGGLSGAAKKLWPGDDRDDRNRGLYPAIIVAQWRTLSGAAAGGYTAGLHAGVWRHALVMAAMAKRSVAKKCSFGAGTGSGGVAATTPAGGGTRGVGLCPDAGQSRPQCLVHLT